jgi:pimeloyl-ACP methyl ester carboxylesterase
MGGYSVTEAAAALPDAFSRLVLMDPVILAPEAYAARGQWFEGDEHPTAKRRNHWQNWEEMFARFESRMPFAAWDRAVLEDYCRYGVLPDPDPDSKDAGEGGGFVLACPPKIEAAIYMGSSGRDIHAQLSKVQVPVTVLRARARTVEQQAGGQMDFSTSPTFPELASRFPQGRDVHLADHSHFIPMEDPQLAAQYILGQR